MTIIAYRDGIMAADRQVSKGSIRYGEYNKIKRLPDGSLFAATGSGDDCDAVYLWLRDGGDKPKVESDDGFRAIIAKPGCEYPFEMGGHLNPREMRVRFAVLGEPNAEAMCIGAMSMGATSERAVEIAIEHTVWVGGRAQVEAL